MHMRYNEYLQEAPTEDGTWSATYKGLDIVGTGKGQMSARRHLQELAATSLMDAIRARTIWYRCFDGDKSWSEYSSWTADNLTQIKIGKFHGVASRIDDACYACLSRIQGHIRLFSELIGSQI